MTSRPHFRVLYLRGSTLNLCLVAVWLMYYTKLSACPVLEIVRPETGRPSRLLQVRTIIHS